METRVLKSLLNLCCRTRSSLPRDSPEAMARMQLPALVETSGVQSASVEPPKEPLCRGEEQEQD